MLMRVWFRSKLVFRKLCFDIENLFVCRFLDLFCKVGRCMAPWTLPYLYSLLNNIISTILMNLWTVLFLLLLYSFFRVLLCMKELNASINFGRFWLYVFFCKFIWINIGLLLKENFSKKNVCITKCMDQLQLLAASNKPLSIVSLNSKE